MRATMMLLGAALALSAGCASSTRQTAADRLRESVEGYNHAFRWKNYERAALYLPQDQRTPFLAAYEDDESSLNVEDFIIREVNMLTDKSATVSVKVSYLLLPSVTVQSVVLAQHWADVNGNWVLEAEDNSIRKLDASKEPRDPRARKKPPEPEPGVGAGDTKVDVERPGDPGSDPELEHDSEDPDEPRW